MDKQLRQLDILIGATQFHIRKAQEVFDSDALSQLQSQYRKLIHQRFDLLCKLYDPSQVEICHD